MHAPGTLIPNTHAPARRDTGADVGGIPYGRAIGIGGAQPRSPADRHGSNRVLSNRKGSIMSKTATVIYNGHPIELPTIQAVRLAQHHVTALAHGERDVTAFGTFDSDGAIVFQIGVGVTLAVLAEQVRVTDRDELFDLVDLFADRSKDQADWTSVDDS